MARQARKNIDTPFLHIMVQGVNKEYIFYKEEYIEKYLEIIDKKIKDYSFEFIAYCIMSNHAHFLVYSKDISEFGKFMQRVNLIYSQMYNRNEDRCGILFRNRYQSEPIYDTRYLINCIKYIHNNPVKANIVEKCEEYKYSSYNDYINNVGLSQTHIMKQLFGNECNYSKLFDETYEKIYMDIEDENNINENIEIGINEFRREKSMNLVNILSNREVLKDLIIFLKQKCKIKYTEMQNFFDISKSLMNNLKN